MAGSGLRTHDGIRGRASPSGELLRARRGGRSCSLSEPGNPPHAHFRAARGLVRGRDVLDGAPADHCAARDETLVRSLRRSWI